MNGTVFFTHELAAQRLRRVDPDRDQAVLRFATTALVKAGRALLTCRFNNGTLDRRPLHAPRLRAFDDYRPTAVWQRGDPIREVAAWGGVPAGVPFKIVSVADLQP